MKEESHYDTHIPAKTSTWEINTQKNMQQEAKTSIQEMIRKINKVFLVDDFNSKEINFKEAEVKKNAGSWG